MDGFSEESLLRGTVAAVLAPKKLDCILSQRKRPVTAAHFATDASDWEGQEEKCG